MSSDIGIFVQKQMDDTIVTGEFNCSTGHRSSTRVCSNAEEALTDIERRIESTEFPYEGISVSGFLAATGSKARFEQMCASIDRMQQEGTGSYDFSPKY